jgi:23S rRNA pseudouridine1911/1915/1917 synthase
MREDPDDVEEFAVSADMAGGRLDAVLAALADQLSRNRIKALILEGAVSVDGQTIREPKYRVKSEQLLGVLLPPLEDAEPQPQNIPLEVLYEDEHLIVIDKPAGLVVHPAPGAPDGTLVNALLFHCAGSLPGIGGQKRPGIVHRLDKDTSGVMVAAKTELALKGLAEQFADHGRTGPLHRAYVAFCWGMAQAAGGTIDAPLGRDPHNRLKQAVRKDGREAITHYHVERRFGGEGWEVSQLECQLETGRTHQIRVHMAHIGHPLIGDGTYAPGFVTKVNRLPEEPKAAVQNLNRQALHAAELGFAHPASGEEMMFEAPLPPDMADLEAALDGFDRAKARL